MQQIEKQKLKAVKAPIAFRLSLQQSPAFAQIKNENK